MLGQTLSRERRGTLITQARAGTRPWLQLERDAFRDGYDKRPFVIGHRLPEHPRFSFSELARLCRRLPADQVKHRFGPIPGNAEFDTSLDRFRGALSLDDALDRMEERKAYIAIYNPERDPEYLPIIEGLLGELANHVGDLDPRINWYSTYIFVSAQDSVTPYHMDGEINFLLQIRGTKTVRLWDPFDDEIMTSQQRDLLLADLQQTRPQYKPSFETKARIIEPVPGLGVHHPYSAPHLVQTGPALSVSLAITFRTDRTDVLRDAHRFNHQVRRLGMRPLAVGSNPFVDRAKAAAYDALRSGKRLVRRLAPRSPGDRSP